VAAAGLLVVFHLPLPWNEEFAGPITMPLLYDIGILVAVTATLIFLGLYSWRLAKEARQMAGALAATETVLAHEQKLHALDGLAAAAAHELGTPLATIALVSRELERDMAPDDPRRDDVLLLRSQAQRCREILQRLTKSPSAQDPMHSSVSIGQLLEEAVERHRSPRVVIKIDAAPALLSPEGGAATAEPVGERRPGVVYGIGNILENAVDFATSKVDITARWSDREVTITIADDGPGFQPEILETIGEPYVTTRPGGRSFPSARHGQGGLGLGFFIAKTLLERSGAALVFGNLSSGEHGAFVKITWPREAFEASASPWPSPKPVLEAVDQS
ncbi:MAG: ActS/PrrB/RegB family redox-sensitive histidine kinase, partial [Hyphomicrobiaceae bacterium]